MIVSLGVFHVFDQDKSQKLIDMSVSYNSSIKVFHTLGTRAALVTDSSRSTLQAIMEEGMRHQTAHIIGHTQQLFFAISLKDKTFPFHGKIIGSIPILQ